MVIIGTTVLFALVMAQMAMTWYNDDRVLIRSGSTRESMYIATTSSIPVGLHLFNDTTFFSALITADWLMVRCTFHFE